MERLVFFFFLYLSLSLVYLSIVSKNNIYHFISIFIPFYTILYHSAPSRERTRNYSPPPPR